MTRRISFVSAIALGLVFLASATSALGSSSTAQVALNGQGSSFVNPLVQTWAPAMANLPGIDSVTYLPVGSGAGIAAITNRTGSGAPDFGATDAPMTPEQYTACNNAGGSTFVSRCQTFPWAFAGTAIAYQGTGLVKNLKLSGSVLANIYLGKVTKWNDKSIKALNKGKSLPNLTITPIYRSDASGTSYNFTQYLSAVSSTWKKKIGTSTQPAFPVGQGAPKSSGVAKLLQSTDGGIIYVDAAYATKNGFNMFQMQNAAGKFWAPTAKSIKAAALSTKAPKITAGGFTLNVVNPTKAFPNAYPICTYTYVIIPQVSKSAVALKKIMKFAISDKGQAYGDALLFEPMPKKVVTASTTVLGRIHT